MDGGPITENEYPIGAFYASSNNLIIEKLKNMKKIPVLCTFILSSLISFGQQKSLSYTYEMELFGSRPAIRVFINGRGPFTFLIDTGAEGEARIDSLTAVKLNLVSSEKTEILDGSGSVQAVSYMLKELKLGAVSFRNVKAHSRNYNRNAAANGYFIDGILGFDLFKNYLFTLDYINKKVMLTKRGLLGADDRKVLPYQAPYGTPVINLNVGPLVIQGDIDTGDESDFTVPTWFLKLLPHDTTISNRTGNSASGSFKIQTAIIKSVIRLGEYEFDTLPVSYTNKFHNVNIGSRWLKRYVITFDQKNKLIKFEDNQP